MFAYCPVSQTSERSFSQFSENIIHNILRRKANWINHILRRNCLLHEGIEGQITERKGLGRRRTQLFDDLRNRRRYWELKEEAEDRERWKRHLINRTYKYKLPCKYKYMGLLISSMLNNSSNNNNFIIYK